MFFPYRDDNPRILIPYVTYAILTVNVLVFVYQTFLMDPIAEQTFALRFGLIPAYFWGGDAQTVLEQYIAGIYERPVGSITLDVHLLPAPLTLLTSTFIHGDLWHIIVNMVFLYVFADNVESALGHVRFAVFYLLASLAADLLQVSIEPGSVLPVVGASGAVSGVLGGYIVRYPRARIHVLVFIFPTIMPAIVMLGLWFIYQFIFGMMSLQAGLSGGVAWFEHIGGFVAGLSYMLILGWRRKFRLRQDEYY